MKVMSVFDVLGTPKFHSEATLTSETNEKNVQY